MQKLWFVAMVTMVACSAEPATTGFVESAVSYSSPFQIWEREHAYQGNRTVWDPSVLRWVSVDHNQVYQLDSAPYYLYSDRREMWTTNYRCMHTNPLDSLGWHRSPQLNFNDWQFGSGYTDWCQRIDWDPGAQPASYFPDHNRWWTQATAATWGSIETWSNGSPVNFTVIRFTENKSLVDGNHVLRRAAPGPGNHDYWGYADINMDGSPTHPERTPANTQPYDDVGDGFYQGFITLGTIPVNAGSNWGMNAMAWDVGPVIWPKHGYRQWRSDVSTPPGHGANWQQTSRGVRQGHIFQWAGYLYIYYWQEAGIDFHGVFDRPEDAGIFVARAPITSAGWVGGFTCGADFAAPCLPAGYSTRNRDAWEASLALPGPNVPPLIGSGSSGVPGAVQNQYPGVCSFSVAAIADTSPQRFVGVAETYDGARQLGAVEMFTSTDLVTWAHHSTAMTWRGAWNAWDTIHYPQPVRVSNGDMTTVDAAQFYLVGSSFQGCSGWPCTVKRVTVNNF